MMPFALQRFCLAVFFFVAAGFALIHAAPRTWDGTSGNWTNDAKWGGTVPTNGESAILPAGTYTVTLAAATADLAAYTQNGGNLLFTNWTTALKAGEVQVLTGTVTCALCDTNGAPANTNRVWIIATNVIIGANGSINADGRGYAGGVSNVFDHNGQGPGGAVHGAAGNGTAGGSYGGKGGNPYYGGYPLDAYGVADNPVIPGSGGAGRDAFAGGNGGGAICLQMSNCLTVHGTITANGANGYGAGSGGGIYITCVTVAGTGGTVRANGGNGTGTVGSGGGGGRVAITYDVNAQKAVVPLPAVIFSAKHGCQDGYYGWPLSRDGNPGTVYFSDSQLMSTSFGDNEGGKFLWGLNASVLNLTNLSIFDRRAASRANMDLTHNFATWVELPEVRSLTVTNTVLVNNAKLVVTNCVLKVGGDLIFTNYGRLYVYSGETNAMTPDYGALVSVTGQMVIAGSNSWVFPYSHPTNGGSVLFRMRDLTIQSYFGSTNAGFNADAVGYSGGQAPTNGWGPGGGVSRGGGGGYGGKGGGGETGNNGGVVYGSSNAPIQPGSGGADWTAGIGAYGGGLVRIEAQNTVTVNGLITANGGNAPNYSGAGSGGGVFIKCARLTATNGIIQANGGYATQASYPVSGGGGGRIAIWRAYDQFAGTCSVAGGLGYSWSGGSNGTIVWAATAIAAPTNLQFATVHPAVSAEKTISVSYPLYGQAGNQFLNFTNVCSDPWLTAAPANGDASSSNTMVTVRVASPRMAAGIYTGQVSVSAVHPDTGAATTPATAVEAVMAVIINRGAIFKGQ